MTVAFDYTETCIREYSKTSSALVLQSSIEPLPFGITVTPDIKSDLDMLAWEAFQFDILLGSGLDLLLAIKQLDEEYSAKVAEGKLRFSKDVARRIRLFYEEWYSNCPRMMQGIEYFEGKKYPLDNAKDYRKECRQGLMPGLSLDNIASGDREARTGRGKTLAEVKDAIRRRTLKRGRGKPNRHK